MECITITVPCLLLNSSLIMGWYFGVLMNEEFQMVKHLSKQVSMPLYSKPKLQESQLKRYKVAVTKP
jgi:hypothetical protein